MNSKSSVLMKKRFDIDKNFSDIDTNLHTDWHP